MALPGRIVQRGKKPVLVIVHNDQTIVFEVIQIAATVYKLDDARQFAVNGTAVDILITQDKVVIHYCESVEPLEVDEVFIS